MSLMEARAITARLAAAPADIANVSMGDATDYHPGWVYHGLIVGTAMDAASLLRQLLQGTLLEEGTLSRMLEGRPLPQFRTERYPDPAYGMGLMLHSGFERQTRSTIPSAILEAVRAARSPSTGSEAPPAQSGQPHLSALIRHSKPFEH
jgi:hypothetical protein